MESNEKMTGQVCAICGNEMFAVSYERVDVYRCPECWVTRIIERATGRKLTRAEWLKTERESANET